MEKLLEKSESLVARSNLVFKRYLFDEISWKNRLIGIKGARGTGKTTLLLQRLLELGLSSSEAVYLSLDDLYFTSNSLIDFAEQFHKQGGKFLFLDEVHKFNNWAQAVKNLYDFYPDLNIIFTGSSIIDIAREEADLSRRVIMYELFGLSYREYLNFQYDLNLPVFRLNSILKDPRFFRKNLNAFQKPLQYFKDYLIYGYYPFFKEDEQGYHQRLQQLIRIIVEYDMAELKDFDIRNAKKMLQLLHILAENVPFKPNYSKLARKSGIHRNSITSYLYYLQEARLIRLLYPAGASTAILQKPEKVYLNNTNLAYSISIRDPNVGNLRETFFISQINVNHNVLYPGNGDFKVDGKWTFEIDGLNKGKEQLSGLENAFVVKDNLEFPVGKNTIPLWMFGFLY